MPSDEFYENEFEALVPHPPVAAHNVPSPPARPPEGLDEDVMTPETSPLHEYGRLDLDNAVFEPDDFFMAAAQNKGIVDVEREFAPKVLSDFFHGLAKTSADLASQIAAKRLASYEFSRSRKMALVLRERERLIRIELSSRQDQHTHHTPPSQHSRSSSRGNKYLEKGVASLRPPALAVPASQTDSLELWREKLRFTQTQEAKNTRAKFFREKRTHDEGARQEAAYNEMRIRHLVTSVQQRELERLNEGVAVERHKRYEHARRVRQAMRAEWQAASQAKSNTLEGKQTNVEAHLQHLVSARRSETTHRAALREQRIKNAELVRRYTDEQRDRALEEKSDKRNEVGKRKMDLEAGRMLALRHKRELQEAYSKQVVATSAKMSELKASEVCTFFLSVELHGWGSTPRSYQRYTVHEQKSTFFSRQGYFSATLIKPSN